MRADKKDRKKSALIVLENAPFREDPRVKNEARSLGDLGWDVHVVCPAINDEVDQQRIGATDPGSIYKDIQVHDYAIKMGIGSNLRIAGEYIVSGYHIARISWLLWRKHRFSVIHICNPPDFLFIFALIYKLMGSRVIFDHHDLFPEMILIRFRGVFRWFYFYLARLLEYLTFRTADFVLSTNESYKAIAIGRGGMKPENIYVVRNGPMLSLFTPEKPNPMLKNGFPFMASYAGVMNKEDGVIELIDIIDHIVKNLGRKDIIFYLLGNGGMYDAAVKKVGCLGLKEFVRLPGKISNGKYFRTLLSTSDVLLAPEQANPLNDKSTFIKIAEYMVIGKPIVAFDLKETRFTAGNSALYAPSGDIKEYARLILSLIDDPVQSTRIGKAGQARAVEFLCWENQKKNLWAAYDAAWGLRRK